MFSPGFEREPSEDFSHQPDPNPAETGHGATVDVSPL